MNRRSVFAVAAALLAALRGRSASAQSGVCAAPGGFCSAAVPCCAGTCSGSTPFAGVCVTAVRSPLLGSIGGTADGGGGPSFTAQVRRVIRGRERTLERRAANRFRVRRKRSSRRSRIRSQRHDRRNGRVR